MAPKRGRDVVSSSNLEEEVSPEYDVNKFVSKEAQDEFENLLTKGVVKERAFIPSAEDGELGAMVKEHGWSGFCAGPVSVPLSIVREFYANAKQEKNGFTWVRGQRVDYTPRYFRRILSQPKKPRGVEDWVLKTREDVDLDAIIAGMCIPGTAWQCKAGTNQQSKFPASALTRYARAWFLFMCARIMPTTHISSVTVDRAIILWGILTGQYIDLGYLVHKNILKFLGGSTTAGIPHAALIAELCVHVGVIWSADETLHRAKSDIDHHAMQRLAEWPGGTPHPRGLGYIDVVEGGGVPPPVARVRQQTDGAGPSRAQSDQTSQGTVVFSDAQYRRMLRRYDTTHDMMRRFATDLTQSLDGVYRQQGVQVTWPTFGAHHIYPPPDTPPEEGGDADN
ncbi:hypothetical protein POM88_015864 [Heracleum sosnowskyi]|uniref:Putative plant transposon protein domain-containing protein n=1 Tax=Heracleum sosnowskyi TaxID=360622 RepID=A0AAD8IMR6_9APIA|nr:hypothetical protein POM88_015864 [Heracleum sosnowskyi]